jgi:hypothetical protein
LAIRGERVRVDGAEGGGEGEEEAGAVEGEVEVVEVGGEAVDISITLHLLDRHSSSSSISSISRNVVPFGHHCLDSLLVPKLRLLVRLPPRLPPPPPQSTHPHCLVT